MKTSTQMNTVVRYKVIEEVPLYKFAVFPSSHPDIKIIKKAYYTAGVGLGIDYSE